ncbi:MAG: hypothetical protein LM590_15835 [Thermofilum sp.]|nr:hypothetical protein [Thermofilum sp.]
MVFYEKRRAVFRVTVARGLASSHIVCLKSYPSDCGKVATISGGGQITLEIEGYLAIFLLRASSTTGLLQTFRLQG